MLAPFIDVPRNRVVGLKVTAGPRHPANSSQSPRIAIRIAGERCHGHSRKQNHCLRRNQPADCLSGEMSTLKGSHPKSLARRRDPPSLARSDHGRASPNETRSPSHEICVSSENGTFFIREISKSSTSDYFGSDCSEPRFISGHFAQRRRMKFYVCHRFTTAESVEESFQIQSAVNLQFRGVGSRFESPRPAKAPFPSLHSQCAISNRWVVPFGPPRTDN